MCCEDFAGTLPTLDYQGWLEGDKLLYKFFMKPMAKKTVIMMSSALGENVKVAALSQEVVRLSKNTSELVDIETRSQMVDNFYERLQLSGYGHEQSVRIITSGLKGYERIRINAAKSGNNINRSEEKGRGERLNKKLLGKTNWFKSSQMYHSLLEVASMNKICVAREPWATGDFVKSPVVINLKSTLC